ncbi:MAG: peroxiredoxin-like family protein [Sphingomonadales bacterium]
MSLTEQIQQFSAQMAAQIPPEKLAIILGVTEKLKASGIENKCLAEGDTVPDFELPSHKGGTVSSKNLLAKGPVVISFYRGEWCPYCNLELKAFQDRLPELEDLGATLVAVSPQTPDHSLSAAEKNQVSFDVLSDHGNEMARKFGLVFTLAEELRPIYEGFGIDLPAFNGTETFELPIPATYVVGADGKIIKAFVDANYVLRLDPDDVIAALKAAG